MRYIKFSMVDKFTNVPVWETGAKNGRSLPKVEGLEVIFADESNWPIPPGTPRYPVYYGTCPDSSDIKKPGIINELSETEYNEEYMFELNRRKEQKRKNTNNERDRRISLGMSYIFSDGSEGTIQLRDLKDKTNIQYLGSKGLKLKIDNDVETEVLFRDLENQQHYLNGDQLIDLAEQVSVFIQTIYSDSWMIKDDLDNTSDFDTLNNINISDDSRWSV